MPVTVRPYVGADRNGVVALWREAFPNEPARNVPEEEIRRKDAVQPELFLVAADGDRIVGTTMAGYDGHRGWVYRVAVAPDYRRRGIGRMLMERAERDLATLGCPKVNLQVHGGNDAVVAFYEKLGYVVEPRTSMGKVLRTPS